MEKNEVKELERKIRNFYRKDKIIYSYQKEIERLKSDIVNIQKRIKECDFNIPVVYGMSLVSERVQNSSTGESNVERELIKCVSRLENKKIEKLKEIEKIQEIIDLIEKDSLIIRRNLNSLDEESIKFLELKYKFNRSGRYIALEMNLSEPTVTRLKRNVLNKILSWKETLMYLDSVIESRNSIMI